MMVKRLIGTAAVAALIAGALVSAPAQAAKRCGKYKPAEPISDSGTTSEAPAAKVIKITDKYTEAKPLVIDYEHGPAFWFIQDPVDAEGQRPAVEDTVWFNLQVDTKSKFSGISIRQQWAETPVSDMDLYLYDKSGGSIGQSADFNQVSGTPINSNTGGPGYEQVLGLGVTDCQGITVESRAFTTPGESMQLIIWVGSVL